MIDIEQLNRRPASLTLARLLPPSPDNPGDTLVVIEAAHEAVNRFVAPEAQPHLRYELEMLAGSGMRPETIYAALAEDEPGEDMPALVEAETPEEAARILLSRLADLV